MSKQEALKVFEEITKMICAGIDPNDKFKDESVVVEAYETLEKE